MSGAPIGTGGDEPQFSEDQKKTFLEKKRVREEDRQKMNDRSKSSVWCTCKNCVIMPTDLECYCCNESLQMKILINQDDETMNCITDNPDFTNIVTNRKVLNMFRYEKVRKGDRRYMANSNAVWRYISYSTFIKWLRAETDLGNEFANNRYVIPACVVTKIRQLYPSADGLYVGHKVRFGLATHYPN